MKRKTKQNKSILLVIALIVLLLIIVSRVITKPKKEVEISNNKTLIYNGVVNDENIDIQAEQAELNKIKGMNERTRIEYYVSNYIKMIEEKEYDKAYSLLNKEYKKNFFNTQKDFENYCEKTFPQMADIQYTNFERNGEIYVIWLTITDAINGTKNSGVEMNFVVKEHSFNDYELSFSVI